MNYDILTSDTIEGLVAKVRNIVQRGYIPTGGVSVFYPIIGQLSVMFIQAVYKPEVEVM